MLFSSIVLRLGFGLDLAPGWLVVMHTYLYYIPLSLSPSGCRRDALRSWTPGGICESSYCRPIRPPAGGTRHCVLNSRWSRLRRAPATRDCWAPPERDGMLPPALLLLLLRTMMTTVKSDAEQNHVSACCTTLRPSRPPSLAPSPKYRHHTPHTARPLCTGWSRKSLYRKITIIVVESCQWS